MRWYRKSNEIDWLTEEKVWEYIDISFGDQFYDLYPGFSEIPSENAEYRFGSEEAARRYARVIIDVFRPLPSTFEVYRVVRVSDPKDINLNQPGKHWSLKKDKALSLAEMWRSNYLLTAEMDKRNINWLETIQMFDEFSSDFSIDDEWEIVPSDQQKLRNIKVERIQSK